MKSKIIKSQQNKINGHAARESSPDPMSENGAGCKELIPEHNTPIALRRKCSLPTKPPYAGRAKPVKVVEGDGELSWNGGQESLQQTFGTGDSDLMPKLLVQVDAASPDSLLGTGIDRNSSLAALHGIAPRDALEGMLAVQMVAVHNHSIEFLQKALKPGQPDEVVTANVNRATKLMRTFTAQVEALTRYRNHDTQNLVVEQVHVHGGGQAIVGSIGPRESTKASEEKNERSS
jgi:hypothetical protein